MELVRDLTLHVDALLSAMQTNTELFAPVMHYVKELARALRLPSTEVEKSLFIYCRGEDHDVLFRQW